MPSSCKLDLEQEGTERVEIAGLNDKRQVTATLAGTLSGKLLPLQILYTKERLRDAILPRHSLMVLTYGIHRTVGPMKKPRFDSLRMSFCHTFKMCVRSHLLLIRLPLRSLMSLKVICVTVCTFSLKGTKFFRCTSQTTVLISYSHLT